MKGMDGENCPFEFNFDPETFKPGDSVSYRVTGSLEGFPFAGVLLEVHPDHVILTSDPNDAESRMKATRESRPLVAEADSSERVIHFKLGKTREARTVRVGRDLLLDVDRKSEIAGLWLLNVPPFPDGMARLDEL